MAYFNKGVNTKCSRCLEGMQVYEDIHKNGVWTCPTCGYTNTVNFKKAKTYTYPDSPMKIGVTYHYIPYDKPHEMEVKKWEHEKDMQYMRHRSQHSSKMLKGDGCSRTPKAPTSDDISDTHGLDEKYRDDSFIRAAEDAERNNKCSSK